MSLSTLELRLPANPPEAKPQIHALTGLRFLAALHVVLMHLWIHFPAGFSALPAWAVNFVGNGYLGVPLFFLLSGFVMALSYLKAPPGREVSLDARRFWVARLARIYPVYLLSLLVALPLFLGNKLAGPLDAWGSVKALINGLLHGTLLQAWHPRIILDWNPPAWSLSVEAFFYASFPLAVMALGLARWRRPALLRAAALLWLLSCAVTLGVLLIQHLNPGLDAKELGGFRCVFPLLRLPDFLLGVVVGRLFMLRQHATAHPGRSALLSVGSALVILVAMGLVPESTDHNLVASLMLLPFAVFLYGLAHPAGPFSALLSTPAMVALGEASYSLYILHWPALYWAQQGLSRLEGHPLLSNPLCTLPLFIALITGVSLLVFRTLEAPLRDRIKRACS